MFKDYYQILGLKQDAKPQNIKKAYRRLALKFHPDRNTDKKAAEEKFKIILEAYQTLSDAGNRQLYDLEFESKSQSYQQTHPEEPEIKVSRPRPKPTSARDKSIPAEYSWSEAIMGRFAEYLARKKTAPSPPPGVKLVRVECPDCNGRGLRYFISRCPRCAGEGHYKEVHDSVYKVCPACRGNGYGELFFFEALCDYCDGLGIVRPKFDHSACPHCQGFGWTLADKWWRKIFSVSSRYFIWQKEECYWCDGSGIFDIREKNPDRQCKKCKGQGQLGINILRKKRTCPKCKGSGINER
jgi:DnaJ-class molecular chaperone